MPLWAWAYVVGAAGMGFAWARMAAPWKRGDRIDLLVWCLGMLTVAAVWWLLLGAALVGALLPSRESKR